MAFSGCNKNIVFMTDNYSTIIVDSGIVTTITLNRPKSRNAMNSIMISELTDVFHNLNNESNIRLIVLKGAGKSFCAGADLIYMKDIARFDNDENYKDALKLANLFVAVYECVIPTIAVVHGASIGGANGILAACDIVIAEENTTFAFSEVKLGISPATIAPFIIRRIGEYNSRYLMLSGKPILAAEAQNIGLVNIALPEKEINACLQSYIVDFFSSAPMAVRATKKLINHICNSKKNIDKEIQYTAKLIADLRAGKDGQEGMNAFFEKRNPEFNINVVDTIN